jgi:predicted  nucleic acid-binding Zn-ribbon protein
MKQANQSQNSSRNTSPLGDAEMTKQQISDLTQTNQLLEEQIAKLQVDLDCVLKDNEDKNTEIASLNREVKLQQIKNENLYTGVKSASDEAQRHANEFRDSLK